MRMTPLDRSLFGRATLAAAAGTIVVAGVVVLTDEASSTLGMRLARLAALGPAVSAVAVLGVTAHTRARGELRAVEALGAPPWRAAQGAAWAGWLAAVLGLVLLVLPLADPSSLFPVLPALVPWELEPGGHAARAAGVVVADTGRLSFDAARVSAEQAAPPSVLHALLCIGPIGLLVPAWAVTPMPVLVRATSVGFSAAGAIVLLHGVAASRAPALSGALAALPLAATTLLVRRRA